MTAVAISCKHAALVVYGLLVLVRVRRDTLSYMSSLVSVRLEPAVQESATSYMRRTGWNRTSLINTALVEWLRMQDHPEIRFVTTATGSRVAALVNGPEVWTVAESWMQHEPAERVVDNVVQATGLTHNEVEAALGYYADFRDEIDTEIERVHLAQEQARLAWERRQALNG